MEISTSNSGETEQGPKLTFLGRHQLATEFFFYVAIWKNVVAKKCHIHIAPAIRMLWETAEKTWRQTFALIVAVKRCDGLIITGKSVLYFKSSKKVKSE